MAQGQVESQRLLVPEPVDLPAARPRRSCKQAEVLARLGLEVEPFGGDTVLVRSLPAMLPHVVPERLVRDLAEHLRTRPLPPTRDGLLAELLHMVACKAGDQGGPAPHAPGDRLAARAPAPRGRFPPLPARPADRPGLHHGRSREAIRADLIATNRADAHRAAKPQERVLTTEITDPHGKDSDFVLTSVSFSAYRGSGFFRSFPSAHCGSTSGHTTAWKIVYGVQDSRTYS